MVEIDALRKLLRDKFGEHNQRFHVVNMALGALEQALGVLTAHGHPLHLEPGHGKPFLEWPKMFVKRGEDGSVLAELVVTSPEAAKNLSEDWKENKPGEAKSEEGESPLPDSDSTSPPLLGVGEDGNPALTSESP